MSAGGLSYSGLTNYGKVVLPSAESWGTNMNILRDPPKSITTRRIDKVGETSSITSMIDASGNRASEAISLYARGVNPMVSVSYGNEGNNGGQSMSGGLVGLGGSESGGGAFQSLYTGGAAKLPYRIANAGAFRPPVLRQEDLLPLSRQSRPWTSAFAQPGFADFSRKLRTCGTAENTREVHDKLPIREIRPTAVYKIETPISEPYDTKNNIQSTNGVTNVSSGTRTLDITQQNVQKPTKEIYENPIQVSANSNAGTNRVFINNNKLNTDKYINDITTTQVFSNPSTNEHFTSIEEIIDMPELPIQNIPVISYTAPLTKESGSNYIHQDIHMNKNLPVYNTTTNPNNQQHYNQPQYENKIVLERNIPSGNFSTNISALGENFTGSRTVSLAPKIKAGEFQGRATLPSQNRIQEIPTIYESEKARVSRLVNESMQGRFSR